MGKCPIVPAYQTADAWSIILFAKKLLTFDNLKIKVDNYDPYKRKLNSIFERR
jgi:hypothetical protein